MMETARIWAKQSSCVRRKVGAILSMDNRIVAIGYNGTILGKCNACEETCGVCEGKGCSTCNQAGIVTSKYTLHAEQNLIAFASRVGIATEGTTMYVTTTPCNECAKFIAQAGITRVVYDIEYKDMGSIEFLRECNIDISKYNGDQNGKD